MRNNYLIHYGIEGMKWGVRRYQNPDGSLTEAGYKRYGKNGAGIKAEYRISKDFGKDKSKLDKQYKNSVKQYKKEYKAEKKAAKENYNKKTDKLFNDYLDELNKGGIEAAKAFAASTDSGKATATGVLASVGGALLAEIGYSTVMNGDLLTGMILSGAGGCVLGTGLGTLINEASAREYRKK